METIEKGHHVTILEDFGYHRRKNIKPCSHHQHQVHMNIVKPVLHEGRDEQGGDFLGYMAGYSPVVFVLIVL